jgi:ketosteroid isomerase-like protein
MKKSIAWYWVGVLSLCCTVSAQAQQSAATTEKAVTALEERWAKAERENNVDQAAPLLAEQYVAVDGDGKVSDRKQMLADDKALKYTSTELQGLQVAVFGDAAIARYVYNAKGTDKSGKAFDTHTRWTDTWVKMPDGKWQCVASHGTRIKM